jgi:KRAB domain-containing zinc finger protein
MDDMLAADLAGGGYTGASAALVGAVLEEPRTNMASSIMEREDRPTEESPPGSECGEDERLLLLQFHASASAGGGLVQGSGSTHVVYTSRDWACGWCKVTQSESKSKGPSPDGPATLCDKCSCRFQKGHTGPAPQLPTNGDGTHECDRCDRTFASAGAVRVHRHSCAGRDWACGWCKVTQSEARGKRRGPDGPGTLCVKCNYRFQTGYTGPAPQLTTNADGKHECDLCDQTFNNANAVRTHRRSCAGRDWACGWCKVTQSETTAKMAGPDGPATLCTKCSCRFQKGHTGPAPQLSRNADGKYECDRCDRTFANTGAVQTHRRSCAGRDWACGWCKATSEATGKGAGPDGPATLCGKCTTRFRAGHTGPAPQLPTNADGKYECDRCDRTFAYIGAFQ